MSLSNGVISEVIRRLSEVTGDEFTLSIGEMTVYGFRGEHAEEKAQKAHESATMPASGVQEIVSGTYVFLA